MKILGCSTAEIIDRFIFIEVYLGKGPAMKLSTRFQLKGLLRVVRGTAKEITGKLSSNKILGMKGTFERFTGQVQRRIGKAEGAIGL